MLAVDGALLLTGDYRFGNRDEAEWAWGASSELAMRGGVGEPDDNPAHYGRLEVGGEDLGSDPATHTGDPAGFVNNFSLPALEIGAGAHVRLVDAVDNGHRGGVGGTAEALYVDTLRFLDGAGRLDTGGLHLYYNMLDPPGCDESVRGLSAG